MSLSSLPIICLSSGTNNNEPVTEEKELSELEQLDDDVLATEVIRYLYLLLSLSMFFMGKCTKYKIRINFHNLLINTHCITEEGVQI